MSRRGHLLTPFVAIVLSLATISSGTAHGNDETSSPKPGGVDPVVTLGVRGEPAPAAKRKKKRPDLDVVSTEAITRGGEVDVAFTVKNKGRTPVAASKAGIYMSIDNTLDRHDVLVGKLIVPALGKKQETLVKATRPVPIAMPPSAYHVIACADTARKIKERSEHNNCRGTYNYLLTPAVVRVDVGPGGKVATSGVSGGGCEGTLCGFMPGEGNVTFTPTPDLSHRFVVWSGCDGYVEAANRSITFTAIRTSRVCQAAFKPNFSLHWSSTFTGTLASGSVTASASGVTCKSSGSASGSCTFDQGTGQVTLTANPLVVTTSFVGWTDGPDGPCGGVKSGRQVTLTSPPADRTCVAVFRSVI